MLKPIKIKRGLDINLFGGADGRLPDAVTADLAAIVPDDYCGLTPRLLKREGEPVVAGEPILCDKRDARIVVTSPLGGVIKSVVRGERRKILSVQIQATDDSGAAKTLSREELADAKEALLCSGLWAMMRQRPYGIIPNPDVRPRDIYVSTFDSAPLAPAHSLMVEENRESFEKGIEVLSSLTDGRVMIGCRKDFVVETAKSETTVYEGPHPAGNAGTQIAATCPVNKGETVWTVEPETVVRIGVLFATGRVDYSCLVAVSGELVEKPSVVKTGVGAPISRLLEALSVKDTANARVVAGNVLTGAKTDRNGFLRYPYRQVTVIPEVADDCEMLGWASLSTKKYSASRTFFSWLAPKKRKYHFDAKINGGERAIIMAGEYDKVFPMDIYAEYLIKAIIAKDIDKMEQLGIYEVVPEDFALCEFIDTSKLELQKIVREGLDYLRKELN